MQAVGPTGSIAITEHTRRPVEGYFQLKPRGPTRVKGLSEPINTQTYPPSAQSRCPTSLVFSISISAIECFPDEIAADEVRGLRRDALSRAGRRSRTA